MTDQSRPDVPVEPVTALRDNPKERWHAEETSEGRSWWRCVPLDDAMQAEWEARTPAADAPRLAELRAAVEALPGVYVPGTAGTDPPLVYKAAVLALMDTAPSERAGELDAERLADATARVVGWTGARDYHVDWARKVAAEYRRLAGDTP